MYSMIIGCTKGSRHAIVGTFALSNAQRPMTRTKAHEEIEELRTKSLEFVSNLRKQATWAQDIIWELTVCHQLESDNNPATWWRMSDSLATMLFPEDSQKNTRTIRYRFDESGSPIEIIDVQKDS